MGGRTAGSIPKRPPPAPSNQKTRSSQTTRHKDPPNSTVPKVVETTPRVALTGAAVLAKGGRGLHQGGVGLPVGTSGDTYVCALGGGRGSPVGWGGGGVKGAGSKTLREVGSPLGRHTLERRRGGVWRGGGSGGGVDPPP